MKTPLTTHGKTWRLRIAHPVQQLRGEGGVSYVLIALMLPVLIGFVGLVIDIGQIYEVRRQLQTAVDAGSLAGAQNLPESPADARSLAFQYVGMNYSQPLASLTANVSTTYWGNDTIEVTAERQVPLALMPVLGLGNFRNVSATATAIVGSPYNMDCVVPLGIVDTNGGGPGNGFGYTFGQRVELKLDAQNNINGNFQALGIYGPGANNFRDGLSGARCANVSQYQVVDTETGNMAGPTLTAIATRVGGDTHSFEQAQAHAGCPRIVTVPVIDSYDQPGHHEVTILGFTHFYVETWYEEPPNKSVIVGRFLEDVVASPAWAPFNPTGLKVVRLIK